MGRQSGATGVAEEMSITTSAAHQEGNETAANDYDAKMEWKDT